MRAAPCVVGVAEHAGWAHLVCVAAPGNVPAVIGRRRVTLIDPGLPTLPYHHDTIGMREKQATALLARVQQSIAACTSRELQRVVTDMRSSIVYTRETGRSRSSAESAPRIDASAARVSAAVRTTT